MFEVNVKKQHYGTMMDLESSLRSFLIKLSLSSSKMAGDSQGKCMHVVHTQVSQVRYINGDFEAEYIKVYIYRLEVGNNRLFCWYEKGYQR